MEKGKKKGKKKKKKKKKKNREEKKGRGEKCIFPDIIQKFKATPTDNIVSRVLCLQLMGR